MNDQNQTLPAVQEAEALLNGTKDDAAFEKMLKYKKGDYVDSDGNDVKMGAQFIAHCVGYTKCWIKFIDQTVAAKHLYRVSLGQFPPERDELDDNDPSKWKLGIGDKPADPWVLQSILPLENEAGEVLLFISSSFGGKRAIADLCRSYAQRTKRTGISEQPVIKLSETTFPSKKYGSVKLPLFEIVGWDSAREGIREVKPANESLKDEMNDEIPF